MGLVFSVVLLLFIIPIVLGIYFLFRIKKLGILLLCIPLVVTVVIVGWWVYELNHHFVSSTDLSDENIDGIFPEDELDTTFKETYGSYETRDNIYFATLLQFDQILVGANETDQIVYMRTDHPELRTEQGINVGDDLEEVFSAYGANYYKNSEMGRDDSINYVDRDLKLHLQFQYRDERVVQIIFTDM